MMKGVGPNSINSQQVREKGTLDYLDIVSQFVPPEIVMILIFRPMSISLMISEIGYQRPPLSDIDDMHPTTDSEQRLFISNCSTREVKLNEIPLTIVLFHGRMRLSAVMNRRHISPAWYEYAIGKFIKDR
jgi:hypothetical protein